MYPASQAPTKLCVLASRTPSSLSSSKWDPARRGAFEYGTSLRRSAPSAACCAAASGFLPTSGSGMPSGRPSCSKLMGPTATMPAAPASLGSAGTAMVPTTRPAPPDSATCASSRCAAAAAASPAVVANTGIRSVLPLSTCSCSSGSSLAMASSELVLTSSGASSSGGAWPARPGDAPEGTACAAADATNTAMTTDSDNDRFHVTARINSPSPSAAQLCRARAAHTIPLRRPVYPRRVARGFPFGCRLRQVLHPPGDRTHADHPCPSSWCWSTSSNQ